MNESPTSSNVSRDADHWAQPVDKMTVGEVPREAINLNVDGRRVAGPLYGFGQLWQKTYTIQLTGSDITPTELISTWKVKFPEFWPEGNLFYGPLSGVAPGDVAVLNLAMPGGMKVSTGIRVIYADEESFAFITPEGHTFGAMITFSAEAAEGGTMVYIQALIRAYDPIYEIGCRLGIVHKMEDQFWFDTLGNLAAHFGSDNRDVQLKRVLIDKRVRWSEAKNIWHNAAIRSAIYMPVHLTRRLLGRQTK